MKVNKSNRFFYLLFSFGFFAISCSEAFIPDTQEEDQELVVEGFIEVGEGAMPTYVLLTRSIPFISSFDSTTFNSLFVHDAKVTVSDGNNTVELLELCLNDLPPEIKEIAAEILGFDPDNLNVNICAYIDISDEIDRRIGGVYDLRIEHEDKIITSTTTVPEYVPLFNLRWDDPPGEPSDTIARLWVTIDDPVGEQNYYRYLTEQKNEGLIPAFSSVTDDALFDGKEFEFPLTKAEPQDAEFDADSFGFYFRGDSIRIKWMTIDEPHFNFWQTIEFAQNNSGPFSSVTRVASNVNGALGIWGGYAVGYYEDFAPYK